MADIEDAYVSLEDFKAWMDSTGAYPGADLDEDGDDDLMTSVLVAAARQIDTHCGRAEGAFHAAAADPTARTFIAGGDRRYLFVDDFIGTPTVTVNGDAAEVTVMPAKPGRPSNLLKGSFPRGATVIVTARWGRTSTPENVVHANRMLGLKLWERRKSPAGVQGQAEVGFIRVHGIDRDIEALLAGLVDLSSGLA